MSTWYYFKKKMKMALNSKFVSESIAFIVIFERVESAEAMIRSIFSKFLMTHLQIQIALVAASFRLNGPNERRGGGRARRWSRAGGGLPPLVLATTAEEEEIS